MLHVYGLDTGHSREEKQLFWGSRVEVLKDKDKKPYLYAYPMLAQREDGSWLSYGWPVFDEHPSQSPLAYGRYLYSVKDLTQFKNKVRLRDDMDLQSFIAQTGFKKVAEDTKTLQPWYVCVNQGRLT